MVKRIEVDIGEELTGQVADRQAAPSLERREQTIAREPQFDRLLRVRAVDDLIAQGQGADAGNPAPEIRLQDGVVDRREVSPDVAAKHVGVAVAETARTEQGPGAYPSLHD